MKRPLILLIAVIVLVLLFGAGVGVGATRRDDPGEISDVVEVVQTRVASVIDKPLIERDEVRPAPGAPTTCLQGGEVVVRTNAPCVVVVSPAVAPNPLLPPPGVRVLRLRHREGPAAEANLQQRGAAATKRTVGVASTIRLDVFQQGGTLAVTCGPPAGPAATCRLTLG